MFQRWFRRLCASLLLAAAVQSQLHASETPLTLEAVLAAAQVNHPDVQSQARLVAALEANEQSYRGSWDAYIESTANIASHGTYDGDFIDTKLVQPLPFAGMNVYGGYRISGGKFPQYEGGLQTLDAGELYAGLSWNVLESFAIDGNRLALYRARLKAAQQRFKARATALKIQTRAITTYYEWLAASAMQKLYQRQLRLVQQREAMLAAQVASGNRAKIYAVENQQYGLQRQNDLGLAQVAVTTTANRLNLFVLRTDTALHPRALSAPVRLLEDKVPADFAANAPASPLPELEILRLEQDLLSAEVRVANNQRLPKLVVDAKVKRDLGNGAAELAGTDVDVGAYLKYPLQNRKARGRAAEITSRLAAVEHQIIAVQNRWDVGIANLTEQIRMYDQIADNTRQEYQLAMALEDAEHRRWQSGDGDLLLVNIREQNTAKAGLRHIKALVEQRKLWAKYLESVGYLVVSAE